LRPPDFESGASASSATPGLPFQNNMPPPRTQDAMQKRTGAFCVERAFVRELCGR
jgi:hypothetical protein